MNKEIHTAFLELLLNKKEMMKNRTETARKTIAPLDPDRKTDVTIMENAKIEKKALLFKIFSRVAMTPFLNEW